MQFRQYISRRITNIQIHDGDNRQETTGQTNERENIRDEENDRNDQTKYLRREKQEKHNTGSPDYSKRKTNNQRGTDTKNEKIRYQAENKNNRKPTMQILQRTELEPNTQMPRRRLKLQQLRKERTLRTSVQTKNKEQPNSEKTYRRRRNRTE